MMVGAGALLVLALGLLLWDESLEIFPQERTYVYRRGFWLVRRRRQGRADDFRRLVLQAVEHTLASGERERMLMLRLQTCWGEAILWKTEEEEEARDSAVRLAARLHLALQELPAIGPGAVRPSRVASRLTAGLVATGLLCVLLAMTWPVLNGTKKLRLPSLAIPDSTRGRGSRVPIYHPYRVGVEAYYRGDYAEAEKLFRQASDASPGDPDPQNMLAYALAGQNRMEEALKAAMEAHRRAPAAGYIMDTVGEMHELRREYLKAAEWYRKALDRMTEDESQETHAKYGRTLLALGKLKEARTHLEYAARNRRTRWGTMAHELLQESAQRRPPR
jgi:tetratricopeptide (TPR) repeat protein